MYAHLTTLQLRPDKMDEVLHIYEHGIIPLVQQQAGCRFITLLTDHNNQQVIAIGWWETEADLIAGQKESLYQQQWAQIHPILLTSPVCTSYFVSIQVAPI
jgi:heme-degrading monooxygenase HmoA